ncbi:Cytochrome 71D6 [Capsicum annuum]|nr:Cytochrome 71D6 [Capsicum annuum]
MKWKNSNSQTKRLPPSPWKLPLLGSMFHLLGGILHHVLRDLSKNYGPLMHLQLGEVSLVVVTFPDVAKQVLKTHDLAFASRPKDLAVQILFYNGTNIVFSPYGNYWRQMCKICLLELLSAKNVKSFSSIRRDKVLYMVEFFRSSSSELVNTTKRIYQFASSMTCRSTFRKVHKEEDKFILLVRQASHLLEGFNVADVFPSLKFLHVLCGMKGKIMNVHHELDAILENIVNEHKNNGELGGEGLFAALLRLKKEGGLQFPVTNDNIKAIVYDMFAAGTDTSSTTIDWATVEMIKNPSVLANSQAEVRNAFREKETFDENDVEELKYLKLVIKETFRLHPLFPLLLPRECREEVDISDYTIPLKTKVMVNVWAIGRDPKYWNDAESFKPERFEHNYVDFIGNNFEYLPFGSGRRVFPGISFALANIYFPLAQLLYQFDWSDKDTIDISKKLGNGQVLEVFVCHIVGEPELAPLLKFVSDGEGHVEGESGVSFNKDTENDIGTVNRASKNSEDATPFDQPTAHTSPPPIVQPTAHTFSSFVQPNSHISSLPTDQPNAHASFPIVVAPSSSTTAPSSSTVAPTNSHAAPSESIVDLDVESIDGGVEIRSETGRNGQDIGYDKSVSGDRNSLKGKLAGDEPCYLSDEAASFETNSDDVTDEEDEIE